MPRTPDPARPQPTGPLTPRQQRALAALLSSKTLEDAATQAMVDKRSLQRWLKDPAFLVEYRAARRQVFDTVIGRLQRTASKAVDALDRNLDCGRPGDEIRAALGVLDHAAKGLEVGDLLERVEELERLVTLEHDDGPPSQAIGPTAGHGTRDAD